MNTSYYFHASRLEALRQYAEGQVSKQQFSGISWCVMHRGGVVDEGMVGYADHAQTRPMSADTLYRIYSMTKPIVSIRCLQLIEAGKLRLSDPVSRWVPALAAQQVLQADGSLEPVKNCMTIEHLLTHRAGLSYDFLPDCRVADLYRSSGLAADGSRSLEALVDELARHPLAFQPGERWYYSYSIDVLAHVLECVDNQSVAESLRKELFEPLNMADTGFEVQPVDQSRVADMFGQKELSEVDSRAFTGNRLLKMDVEQSNPMSSNGVFTRGGHGLFSTQDDYRQFMQVLKTGLAPDGRPLLSSPMLEMLWQNRLTTSQMPIAIGANAYAGYGWGLTGRIMCDTSRAAMLSANGEGGWSGAASTYFWVDRENDVDGIVMTQYLGSAVPLGADMQSLAYAALCRAA